MKRVRAVLPVLVVLSMALSLAPQSPVEGQARRRRANILIFLTDDQREGLQVMDGVRRQLARKGRSFPNAFATTPVCCPSRASIMTGRYSHNHRVLRNPSSQRLDHKTTLQYFLESAGYRTGYVGKFLNDWPLEKNPPFFDAWATHSVNASSGRTRYYGGKFNINGNIRTVSEYSTDFIGTRAVKFLRGANRRDSRPWLLYVAPEAPHEPLIPARKYRDARVPRWNGNPGVRERNRSDKPPWVRSSNYTFREGRAHRRDQFRMLMSVDDMVKRVLGVLRNLKEARNTLVIFMSDNGYLWSEHGLKKKFQPYTESIRVPLVMRWPGRIGRGSRDTRLVGNIDIAPTVLAAARVSHASGPPFDGKSLLNRDWARRHLLLEYSPHTRIPVPKWASIRSKGYQYVEYYGNDGVKFREYYRLRKDPYQLRNLLRDGRPGNDPTNLSKVKRKLERAKRCRGADCP